MISLDQVHFRQPLLQAFWNMRWPAAFLCGPLVGLVMIKFIYGLPGRLWFLAGGFFLFSCVLFGILVQGEARRLQRRDPSR